MSDFFTDVILKSTQESTTQRVDSLAMLEPITRAGVQAVLADAAAGGMPLQVTETYRSRQRQFELFQQHATQLKTVGVHHYGLAVDVCKVINNKASWEGDWAFLGVLSKKHNLVWGGDWDNPNLPAKAFRDWDHIQRINVADQNNLFNGSWYPDDHYTPLIGAPSPHSAAFIPAGVLRLGDQGEVVKRLQISLTAQGFPAHADGFYGPLTKSYVQAYQTTHKLTADGIAGPTTLKALGLGVS